MVLQRTDAQRNRAHLVKTARKMMRASGRAPSFNELAKHAGVGVGTVYRHFSDAPALLAGLVEAQLASLAAMIADATDDPDPEAGLSRLFHGAVALELESPVVGQLLASQGASEDVASQLVRLEHAAEGVLVRARAAGVLDADVSASDFRRLVCGIELAARAGDDVEASARRYVDITLRGVRPSAPKAKRAAKSAPRAKSRAK